MSSGSRFATINQATSYQELLDIAARFSANALRPGGHSLFYSGAVVKSPIDGGKDISGQRVASDIARNTGANMVDETPRARFLADTEGESALRNTSVDLEIRRGATTEQAREKANRFLFGSRDVPRSETGSLENSLWGQASRDYAASLTGASTVVASKASPDRIMVQIEIPIAASHSNGQSIGGQSPEALRQAHAAGGPVAAGELAQQSFRDAAQKGGIYVSPDGTTVHVSREAATHLQLPDAQRFPAAAELAASGLTRGEVTLPGSVTADVGSLGRLAGPAFRSAGIVGLALTADDAVATLGRHYALTAEGNDVGAAHVERAFAARTVGGVLGAAGAGFAVAAVVGAETGPGAVVTGLVGGVVGAAGAIGINHAVERYQDDHQTAPDGVDYIYDHRRWVHRPWFGAATPAPPADFAALDHARTTRITEGAMADATTPQQATDFARGYATEYRQHHWERLGPMPKAVTNALDAHGGGAAITPTGSHPAAAAAIPPAPAWEGCAYWQSLAAAGRQSMPENQEQVSSAASTARAKGPRL